MDTKILLKLLEDQANPTKVPAMEAYMKNKFSFLGVQKPILKKIEREFFKPFINHQLMRKELTDTNLLAEVICNNFGQTEFFINKAIGWSLRNYSKVNPDWVRAFIDQHASQMSSLSIREGSKYL